MWVGGGPGGGDDITFTVTVMLDTRKEELGYGGGKCRRQPPTVRAKDEERG